MAIQQVTEVAPDRSATFTPGERTYRRAFQVVTTDPADGPHLVGTHPAIPRVNELHPEDGNAFCSQVQVDQDGDQQLFWRVTVDYRTQRGQPVDPNPLLRPMQIDYDVQFRRVPDLLTLPFPGEPSVAIENTAGVPYDPPVDHEVADLVIRITKNVAEWNESWPGQYCGKLNDAPWRGYAKRTCKIQRLSAQLQYDANFQDGFFYWTIAIEVVYRRDTHDEKTAMVGIEAIFPAGTDGDTSGQSVRRRIREDSTASSWGTKDFVASVRNLDADGKVVARGVLPIYKQFKVIPEISFDGLGLG